MIAAPLEYRASPAAPGVPLADLGEGPCWDPERQDGFLALDLDTRKVSVIAEVEADRPGNRMNDAACDRTGRMFAGTKAEDDTPGAGSLYRLEPDHRLTTMLTGGTVLRYHLGGHVSAVATVPVLRPTSCAFGGPCLDVLYITTAAGPGRGTGGGGLFACRPGPTGMPADPYRGCRTRLCGGRSGAQRIVGVKALVFTGPATVELRDEPEPEVARGETLVHVRSAGICGSELHGVRHPGFRVPPLIMGHEFSGVSDDGESVVIYPVLSCGSCDLCKRGLRQLCRRRALVGVHRPGGLAERVAVPRSALRPLPHSLSWDVAALIEPAANAVHAWRLAGGSAGMRVAVLGCGAIGLLCLLTALNGEAASVEVTDLSPARREEAIRLGASAASPALEGEYDVIFDAVGSAATHVQSVRSQRPGGVTVWLGLADDTAGFDSTALVRDEKRILGSFAYDDGDFDRAAQLVTGWDLSWATGYPLTAGAEIFTRLMNGGPQPVKALLRP